MLAAVKMTIESCGFARLLLKIDTRSDKIFLKIPIW